MQENRNNNINKNLSKTVVKNMHIHTNKRSYVTVEHSKHVVSAWSVQAFATSNPLSMQVATELANIQLDFSQCITCTSLDVVIQRSGLYPIGKK